MKSQFFTYDQATWPRAQHFHYYAKMFPVHISVNRKIDVTELLPALEKKGYRQDCVFYYMVTRAINNQGELSVAYKDGQIGWWNYLNPAYPVYHEDDETSTILWTEYDEDFSVFNEKFLADMEKYGSSKGVFAMKGMPPTNSFNVFYNPWFSFDGFSVDLHDMKDYFFPVVDMCKIIEENGRQYLPISITVHKAATDLIHLKKFFDDIESYFPMFIEG